MGLSQYEKQILEKLTEGPARIEELSVALGSGITFPMINTFVARLVRLGHVKVGEAVELQ